MKKWLALALLVGVGVAGMLVTPAAQVKQGGPINPADTAWILTATALVLLMTPGLSFFYGGMVRLKNVVSTLLQSYIAMAVISLLWVVVGFSLCFGDSIHGIIGDPRTFFMFSGVGGETHPDLAPTIPLMLFALFQLKFAIITPALITGAFAERVRFKAYVLFMVLFTLVIYAPLAHWTWHPKGFLREWGVLDFAGGTVVHMSAGFAALAGALVLGRRQVHLENASHTPANLPFVMLGTGMLWFGWFGFNAGSALSASSLATLAFATTNTASAAAMLGWIAFDWLRGRKPSAMGACVGAVVGLVAVTPAAGFITVGQSIMVGLVASFVSNAAVHLKSRTSIDDTLDVFPCHGLGGVVGMVLTGVLAKDVGLLYGETKTFFMHMLALALVSAFSFIGSYLLYKLVDRIVPLRVTREAEEQGLDLSQHGETMGESTIAPAPRTAPSEAPSAPPATATTQGSTEPLPA
ncbi:ammonium transporter [Myxococcus sp. CA051A]|uniref:Ammonium transporter n=1 Tax=Myxococcus llanfairpwllgwyngyllgogerychwyrndrobwllllantysiliogogogochensis TaxID=2590453 RepID=A0A540WR61_9BACT|nr:MULTISPECIES: ammonium transporter [Myxococcus]NTX00205.1 ammonium transporter [Myxococcus sp. CA040A]NTX65432.1 ammonium transporter [Myxococcus sp. CA051A]TQF11501.1 ammonium transporter [Myxococcus llanfairpwllgwyngyllgogerychwyrndrobwllllantysiliogogogochensis]